MIFVASDAGPLIDFVSFEYEDGTRVKLRARLESSRENLSTTFGLVPWTPTVAKVFDASGAVLVELSH